MLGNRRGRIRGLQQLASILLALSAGNPDSSLSDQVTDKSTSKHRERLSTTIS
jgi:hypothetical protein